MGPGRPKSPLNLTDDERRTLLSCARQPTIENRIATRARIILACASGLTNLEVAAKLDIDQATVCRWRKQWCDGCFDLNDRSRTGRLPHFAPCGTDKRGNEEKIKEALIPLLHTPPFACGINRTSWKLSDLQRKLKEKGIPVTIGTIRQVIRNSGFKWRNARKKLTSNDPNYKEKVERIQHILSHLGPNERFFSVDEYGPFAIQMRGGRSLVGPGESRVIPQYQKSKGSLIVTAALERSTNQVIHFYSKQTNSAEMLRMLNLLLELYRDKDTLYISWDAVSWHDSEAIHNKVYYLNSERRRLENGAPQVMLVPLPSGSQFLNVIESVFSGMALAVIHNSNYEDEEEAKTAIDIHFYNRNSYFLNNPKRAGDKIGGKERVPSVFSEANNCKNPKFR